MVYEVSHVWKIYNNKQAPANQDISFEVHRGEILGILGPNGAGKTTLVKQMVALIRPTSGVIRLEGLDVSKYPKRVIRMVGYYAQEPHTLHYLRVSDSLQFTAQLRGLNSSEAKKETTWWLDRLGLFEENHRILKTLSGGRRRLVGLACSMIGNTSVLVLDEPTNELDPLNRKIVWDLIRERNRNFGTTVVLVTHNVLEAEQVVDRVAIVDKGKLLTIGSVGELKRKIDQRIKVEFSVKLGKRQQAEAFLSPKGAVETLSENKLRVYLAREDVPAYLNWISGFDTEWCEEYRVIAPSLEDVYIQLGGGGNMRNA